MCGVAECGLERMRRVYSADERHRIVIEPYPQRVGDRIVPPEMPDEAFHETRIGLEILALLVLGQTGVRVEMREIGKFEGHRRGFPTAPEAIWRVS